MTLEERLDLLTGAEGFWEGLIKLLTRGPTEPFATGGAFRLGIAGLRTGDGPRGVGFGAATCFPVAMARAATFDPALEERVGEAIGREGRAIGITLLTAPCVEVLRHPGWGRAQETYGEDPVLNGEMGAAFVRGAQRHLMACVKHLVANSIENARSGSTSASTRTYSTRSSSSRTSGSSARGWRRSCRPTTRSTANGAARAGRS